MNSGMYFRVKRGERYENLLLEEMSGAERMETLGGKDAAFLIRIIDHLCICALIAPPSLEKRAAMLARVLEGSKAAVVFEKRAAVLPWPEARNDWEPVQPDEELDFKRFEYRRTE
jgi:hypothetical protein